MSLDEIVGTIVGLFEGATTFLVTKPGRTGFSAALLALSLVALLTHR